MDKLFKDLKFDKVEGLLYQAGAWMAPYVLPVLGGVVAVFVGATGLYIVEEIDKTDTYTRKEWDALSSEVQRSYHTINGKKLTQEQRKVISTGQNYIDLIAERLIETFYDEALKIEVETEIVKATRKIAPQIIHTVMDFQEWFTGTIETVQKFLDVDDFPVFKMQNMFYYHVRKYFAKLSSLFSDIFDKE